MWQRAEFLKVNSSWHHILTLGSEELNVSQSVTMRDSEVSQWKALDEEDIKFDEGTTILRNVGKYMPTAEHNISKDLNHPFMLN
jgi:hypothetical protein